MKKLTRMFSLLLSLVLILALVPVLANEVSAASNPYPTYQDADGDGNGEIPCTYYAWQQAYDRLDIALPAWGNAINWYNAAQSAGYSVGSTPQANSIAVWSIDTHSWGHVAFVTAINGTQMTINEGGRTDAEGNNGIVNGQVVPSAVNSYWYGRTLIGYIYLTNAPKVSISWTDYDEKQWIGSTNAVLAGWCDLNVDNSAVSKVGIYLYDKSGKQLATISENVSFGGYTYFQLWYDVNDELDYALSQGTTYKYKFFAVVQGKTYDSPTYSFTTSGTHSHKYDSGTVTKKASCTAAGVKTFTCSTCGSTKTEAIAKLSHDYAAATCKAPKTCKNCGATSGSALAHKYDNGTVTKKATCKNTGVKTFTCSACKATKTESIPKLTTHTPGAAATETTPQTCKVCGLVLQGALGHTHNYQKLWEVDEDSHWYPCACGAKKDLGDHIYDNTCDTDCNKCGYLRTITHTPGEPATAIKDQTCTVCGEVLEEATAEAVLPNNGTSHPTVLPDAQPEDQVVTQPEMEEDLNADADLPESDDRKESSIEDDSVEGLQIFEILLIIFGAVAIASVTIGLICTHFSKKRK